MSGPVVYESLEKLLLAPPLDLGATEWIVVGDGEVADFVGSTGGDVSPYFALSLTNRFLPDLLLVPAAGSGVNYGAESVRFGRPLSGGDRVRGAAELVGAAEVPGGVQTTVEIRVEIEGTDEPACVVRSLSRWLA